MVQTLSVLKSWWQTGIMAVQELVQKCQCPDGSVGLAEAGRGTGKGDKVEIGGALTSPHAPKQYPIHDFPELSATFKWYTDRGQARNPLKNSPIPLLGYSLVPETSISPLCYVEHSASHAG